MHFLLCILRLCLPEIRSLPLFFESLFVELNIVTASWISHRTTHIPKHWLWELIVPLHLLPGLFLGPGASLQTPVLSPLGVWPPKVDEKSHPAFSPSFAVFWKSVVVSNEGRFSRTMFLLSDIFGKIRDTVPVLSPAQQSCWSGLIKLPYGAKGVEHHVTFKGRLS